MCMIKSKEALKLLPPNSTDVESDNVIKRYMRRPKALEEVCLADFVACFDLVYQKKEVASVNSDHEGLLPETDYSEQNEDSLELDEFDVKNTTSGNNQQYTLPGGTTIYRRKHSKVIRYVRYSKVHSPEDHYRELLMLFKPWRSEEKDLKNSSSAYKDYYETHKEEIEAKRKQYEHNMDELDKAAAAAENDLLRDDILPEAEHENLIDAEEDVLDSNDYGCFSPGKSTDVTNYDIGYDLGIATSGVSEEISDNRLSDSKYRDLVQSLNKKQKDFFYHVLHWIKTKDEQIFTFLSGGAGVGKTQVTNALYQALVRYYDSIPGENPDELKVLKCAPTGKAAYNIRGNTLHSAFQVPANQSILNYKPLHMQDLNIMRNKYMKLKVVFIDEISMAGNKLFNFVNLRLKEITGNKKKDFGGVSIVAVGDLFQLAPVMDGWIFKYLDEGAAVLGPNIWIDNFKMYELEEIMRQKDCKFLAELLNRLRENAHTSADLEVLKSRIIDSKSSTYPKNSQHLFTENDLVDEHNQSAFTSCRDNKTSIAAIDDIIGHVSVDVKNDIRQKIPAVSKKRNRTMGLALNLPLAEGLLAELTVNVCTEDGLTNGASCVVKKLDFRVLSAYNRCSIVWVLFSDKNIGKQTRQQFRHLYKEGIDCSWTPILEIERSFIVGRHKNFPVKRKQFPLCLSAAKTHWKAQGDTLESVVLHFGYKKKSHLHYVGLSRVTDIKGMHILELNEKGILVDKNVVNEMHRLRTTAKEVPCVSSIYNLSTSTVCVAFVNARSLHLHIKDIRADNNLPVVDVLGIAESRLIRKDKNEDYQIGEHVIHRNDFVPQKGRTSVRPSYGMVIYQKEKVSCININGDGIETTVTSVHLTSHTVVQVVFVYCHPNSATISNLETHFDKVNASLNSDQSILIMGDFNYDVSKSTALQNLMKNSYNYRQLPTGFTTDYKTRIDHIYTNLPQKAIQNSGTFEAYYSDHKPIFVSLYL